MMQQYEWFPFRTHLFFNPFYLVRNSILVAGSIKDENIKLLEDDGKPGWIQNIKDAAISYKVFAPYTKYACCNYKWSIRSNFYKHQVAILNFFGISTNTIIEFCGTWYRINRGGVISRFRVCNIPDAENPFAELEDDDGF